MGKYIPVEPEKWAEMVKALALVKEMDKTINASQAECRRLKEKSECQAECLEAFDKKLREAEAKVERLSSWQPMSSYRGGSWVYLFIPDHIIPGEYRVEEGCYMVGLEKWWTRTERNIDLKPTHWRPLFQPPTEESAR